MPHRRDLIRTAAIAALAASWHRSAQAADRSITVTGISSFKIIETLLPAFTAATGIAVDLQILPYPQLRTRAMADLVGGTANSDVYLQDIVWLGEWASNGYAMPLDGLFARDAAEIDQADLLPGALNALSRWDGRLWSVPVGAFYFLNYFRSDWLAEKQIAAPATLAQFDAVAAALTDSTANRFGVAMPYQRGGPIASWFLATYAGAGGTLLADPPRSFRPTLDSKRALDVLTHYVGWLKDAPRGAIGYHWNDQTVAMQTGRIAMAPTFSVNGTEFAKPDNSVAAGHLGYDYMPRYQESEAPVVPFGGWAAAINAKTTKAEPAWQFLKFLIRPETQLALAATGGTPVRISSMQDPTLQQKYPWLPFILDAEAKGRIYADYRPRYPFYPKIEEVLGLQLNRAALKQASPAEALATANAAILGIVTEAGHPV